MNRTESFDANSVWKHIIDTYSIGQDIVRPVGKVVSALGVFLSLEPGFDALIHVSKIAGLGDQDPRRFYTTGQEISATIINIDSNNHRVELAADLFDFSSKKFLTKEYQVVAQNFDLADLEVTGAVLHGSWISDRPEARAELVARSETEMSIQLQAKCAHKNRQALKVVHVTFRQNGSDIVARADWAGLSSPDHDYGYDLTEICSRPLNSTQDEGGVEIALSADAVGYGVEELYFRKKPSVVSTQNANNDVSQASGSEKKLILVDGSNIVRRWPNLRSTALAGLIEGLRANGYVPICFFDANIHHVLQDSGDVFGQNLLECMMRNDPEGTIIVPAGMRSDDYMLLLADRRGYQIVSCDTYRDESFAKYSWLRNLVESGAKKIHAPAFILGDLVIPTLEVVWPFTSVCFGKLPLRGDVFIQSFSNGKFFCAEDGEQGQKRKIMANRDNPSDWEEFTFIRNSDGSVSIKAKINGKYLSTEVDSDRHLTARADNINESERFWIAKRMRDGLYVLRSSSTMEYVRVDSHSGQVSARSNVANEETWLHIKPVTYS